MLVRGSTTRCDQFVGIFNKMNLKTTATDSARAKAKARVNAGARAFGPRAAHLFVVTRHLV